MARVRAVLMETLRLRPPITDVTKDCVADTTLPFTHRDGSIERLPIKKGTVVNACIWSLHLNERYYERPLEFLPERWLGPKADSCKPYLFERIDLCSCGTDPFYGFSTGAYGCLGRNFAEVEFMTILASFLLRYKVEPIQLATETRAQMATRLVSVHDGITLKPGNDLDLKLTRR
jgi:cytochrome P450